MAEKTDNSRRLEIYQILKSLNIDALPNGGSDTNVKLNGYLSHLGRSQHGRSRLRHFATGTPRLKLIPANHTSRHPLHRSCSFPL